MLERLVDAARGLGGARYAALGVPDEEGDGFSRWISAGLTDEEIDAIGPLPRNHGLLGAALHDPEPFRSDDVRSDDRFDGWWPAAHPDLDAFLAVPIVFRGDVVGAFYLANKDGGFDGRRRAPGARPRRPRRGAHRAQPPVRGPPGAVGARGAEPPGPGAARRPHAVAVRPAPAARGRRHATARRSLLEEIFAELRSLILQLRPPDLERDGLAASLAKHLEVVGRTHGIATHLDAGRLGDVGTDTEQALFRIAQEAVTNVVRHAAAAEVTVRLERTTTTVTLAVTDDGRGFDPARPRDQLAPPRAGVDARAGGRPGRLADDRVRRRAAARRCGRTVPVRMTDADPAR